MSPVNEYFLSPEPKVTLVNAFARPYDNAVATARTCYSSKGIVTPEAVAGDGLEEADRAKRVAVRDALAKSIFQAGHHTTFQHAAFQFTLENVSRLFVWSFLHSHPFYNSEQVSQRYVTVDPAAAAIPPLVGGALAAYQETVTAQMEDYRRLMHAIRPVVEREYQNRFPHKDLFDPKNAAAIQRKAQEVARYVLPVSTFTVLYHTVSGLTLLRYWRMCQGPDVPFEQRWVVGRMVQEMLKVDPGYKNILDDPLPDANLPAAGVTRSFPNPDRKAFRKEFDAFLAGKTARLADYSHDGEAVLAAAVREVMGMPRAQMTDEDAIARVLDPSQNALLGETMNVASHDKLTRALFHPHYTFRKKISHTADSQDQRHRMTPASRPVLPALSMEEPDYVTPPILLEDKRALQVFTDSMNRTWDGIRRLKALGVSVEYASYLLPNAVAIRFTESADLLNLHHKHAMRLCYNAQEEIWSASVDEAREVTRVHPKIGRWLLPPCGLRFRARVVPHCPEGDRFCGVTVWKMDRAEYKRLI